MKLGLLGAAKITPKAVIMPAREIPEIEVTAVAARDPERAAAYAAQHGIPRVHRSYEDLVEDPELDAVYVALPASEHAEWTIAALESGRHVLCEKPFASNASEAEAMVAAAKRNNLQLVEAMHWRYYPMADRMIELAQLIGPLRTAEGRFEVPMPSTDIRFQRALGGGATMDLGCYPLHWLRTVTGEEPAVVSASAKEGPAGVDVAMTAELLFPSGLEARMVCEMHSPEAMDVPVMAALEMTGDRGWFCADNPQAPQFGAGIRTKLVDQRPTEEVIDAGKTYPYQLRAFVRIVAGAEEPLTGGDDAVATMRLIDEIYEKSGLGPRG